MKRLTIILAFTATTTYADNTSLIGVTDPVVVGPVSSCQLVPIPGTEGALHYQPSGCYVRQRTMGVNSPTEGVQQEQGTVQQEQESSPTSYDTPDTNFADPEAPSDPGGKRCKNGKGQKNPAC